MVTFSLYGALMKPTMNFLRKLSADPSLKIKTLSNAVDKRVRTGDQRPVLRGDLRASLR